MQCVPADFSVMHNGHIMVTTAMFGAIVVCILFVIMGTSLAKDIRPFKRAETGTPEEYFSMHLEEVRNYVECTFGILKKKWRILNNGFFHREMVICEKIFITCCWLNNFMLDVTESTNVRVGCGAPIGEGEQEAAEDNDCNLSVQFLHRQSLLVNNYHLFWTKGAIQN
jgi:hypothetical protein